MSFTLPGDVESLEPDLTNTATGSQ